MWLFTPIGYYSIVQKPRTTYLTVRARVLSDLIALRERYLPELSAPKATPGNDYPYRATVSHEAFSKALGKMVLDLDYDNFKNTVRSQQGPAREKCYHRVWETLRGLSETESALPWPNKAPAGLKVAYGGVVLDPDGHLLLREPRNHYDGYVWTFPKGRPDPGETPQETALRETREETGANARILAPIPGEFAGGTTINRYFLMAAPAGSGGVPKDDKETNATRWVTPAEARTLIEQTTNAAGRKRDLAVLAAALDVWAAWRA
jgi:8-oxo-dGTP pyrophosphatase MutT (NUDIX family)